MFKLILVILGHDSVSGMMGTILDTEEKRV
jgi:hypothetical protein